MANAPYELARLVNGDKPLSVRWYVVFRVWDVNTGKMVRKRDYSVNEHKTAVKRKEAAKKLIGQINELLVSGHVVSLAGKKISDIKIAVEQNKDFTVEKAIRFIMPIIKQTKRPETFTTYNSVAGLFLKFCQAAGWDQWKIRTLTQSDILGFLDYIQVHGTDLLGQKKEGTKVSNTTRNNYKTALSALFTQMVERKIIDKNIIFGIKELKEDIEGNTAYTPEQIAVLKPAIQDEAPRLWLFITFMLYGFMRPAEIGRMRVKMFDLQRNVINLPGSITKNHKPKQIRIGAPFRAYIDQLNLALYAPDDFVFGYNLVTGKVPLPKNHAGNVHREIIRGLGFGAEYSLYPWKHTGVINHYRAGIDIKTLQAQIGHQSLQETDIYLRSLNLYENKEFELKSPVI